MSKVTKKKQILYNRHKYTEIILYVPLDYMCATRKINDIKFYYLTDLIEFQSFSIYDIGSAATYSKRQDQNGQYYPWHRSYSAMANHLVAVRWLSGSIGVN